MAHCQHLDWDEADNKPWFHDIKEYLQKGAYPQGAVENGKRTLRRLVADFFLSGPTKMELDCCQHVKRCLKCQVYVNNIYVAFSMRGLDIIRPIELKASNKHRFILVAID
ncbi:hypothetical protein CR513_38634, partial [Mucuna pruriens]